MGTRQEANGQAFSLAENIVNHQEITTGDLTNIMLIYLTTISDEVRQSPEPEARALEEYALLKPALVRLYQEDDIAFTTVALKIVKVLHFTISTIKKDIARVLEGAAKQQTQSALQLLDQMESAPLLRLPHDFVDDTLWFGIVAGKKKLLVNSKRELLTLEQVSPSFTVRDRGFNRCRMSRDAITRLVSTQHNEDSTTLLNDLRAFFTRFIVFRDPRISLLLATWTAATYVYRMFDVFPYLALHSPRMRCGKSRLLRVLGLVAFNALPILVHPSEAVLFRSPSRNGGTMLLDEVEKLKTADKEMYAGLMATLNSGFEAGGSVPRHEKDAAGNFTETDFETYCPRAVAGINSLADTLADRSIPISMQRKLTGEKTERFSPRKLQREAQGLRDRCYLWALTHATDLAGVYGLADRLFPKLASLDDRARDLWEPLLSLVALADSERGDDKQILTEELSALALALSQSRDGEEDSSTTLQVLAALVAIVTEHQQAALLPETGSLKITPTDLCSLLKIKLSWEKLSAKGLAKLLNPLGLFAKSTKVKDAEGKEKVPRMYHLSETDLADLTQRYTQTTTSEESAEQEK